MMMLNIQYWTILVSLVSDIQHGPSIPADKQLIQHQTSLWSLVSKKMNGLSLTQPLPEFSEQRYSCSSDTVTQKRVHLISSRLVEFREEIWAAVTIRSILEDAEIILSVLLCVQGNISPSLDMQEKERNSYC